MVPKISHLIGCLIMVIVVHGDASHLGKDLEYTITPSSQVAYYHYPAPSRSVAATRRHQQYHQPSQQYQQQTQPHHQDHQVVREFAAPALEHAAFTQALTSHGYVFGGAAASAPLASIQPAPPVSAAVPAPPAVSLQARSIAQGIDSNSLNLKLPVPFGLTPLNVAQLPLQAGAPYASVPHTTGLTSYGTPQIQRR
ncbi:uncharacterized protein [Drosophila tropicalis]|uniref:uncharacterized protein n=1 Tax=Drosophila tropicalis TaxID=46794 RepID=UPI0035ABCAD4